MNILCLLPVICFSWVSPASLATPKAIVGTPHLPRSPGPRLFSISPTLHSSVSLQNLGPWSLTIAAGEIDQEVK